MLVLLEAIERRYCHHFLCCVCCICSIHEKKKGTPPKHECCKNNKGSSNGMEYEGILLIATRAPSKCYVIAVIVSDDDKIMQEHLKHPTDASDKKANLPLWILEPKILANPSHQKYGCKAFLCTCTGTCCHLTGHK